MTVSNAQNHRDLVTLRDYIESRLDAIKATMEANEKSTSMHFDITNEFREQITKERRDYITLREHNAVHESIAEDIRMLREAKARVDGKASQASVYVSYIVGFTGIVFGIVNLVILLLR